MCVCVCMCNVFLYVCVCVVLNVLNVLTAGVSSIRAYHHQERFILESERKVDANQTAYYPGMCANRCDVHFDIVNLYVYTTPQMAWSSLGICRQYSGLLCCTFCSYRTQQ